MCPCILTHPVLDSCDNLTYIHIGMSYIVQGRNKLAPKCDEDSVLINERTSLLIKNLSKLFEFSTNLGSYLTGQLGANASSVSN